MILPALLTAGIGMFMANNADEKSSMLFDSMEKLSSVPLIPAVILMTVAATVIFSLSMLLSMKIYNKKEL